jgi:hypothetical protein
VEVFTTGIAVWRPAGGFGKKKQRERYYKVTVLLKHVTYVTATSGRMLACHSLCHLVFPWIAFGTPTMNGLYELLKQVIHRLPVHNTGAGGDLC